MKMDYVIAYDVADDARRNHLAQFLEGLGRRVQKSIFECELSRGDLETALARITEILKVPEDRCHIYSLCGQCVVRRVVLGKDMEENWGSTIIS